MYSLAAAISRCRSGQMRADLTECRKLKRSPMGRRRCFYSLLTNGWSVDARTRWTLHVGGYDVRARCGTQGGPRLKPVAQTATGRKRTETPSSVVSVKNAAK